MYGIEIKVSGSWRPVHQPNGEPYSFAARDEAETMARILYPAMWKDAHLVRIRAQHPFTG